MTLKSVLLTIYAFTFLISCGQQTKNTNMKHTNELIDESSPYLLQHAHNPVNWHAWSAQNLEDAKKMDLPILISIGYSSCHWCHVMEHESFEDETVAAYMNEYFYCIKVDREERPDVDAIYMTAANIITGSGGWPLNCFALPDGKPFHAGTYYPADSWLKLLQSINNQYHTNREKLDNYASKLTQGIRMQETAISDGIAESLDPKVLDTGISNWESKWDMDEGGIKNAPKFPMPSNLSYLLAYQQNKNDKQIDKFIQLTLDKMAMGGIFDQIGGGFSRYSTDVYWKAPHFEKMLYDNAQLLTVYSNAYKKYGNKLYLETIDKTITWLTRDMLDPSGMFYAAIDADSEGEEGKYYTWKTEETKSLLANKYPLAKEYYQIGSKGLWEHGNNILLRNATDDEIANILNTSTKQLKQEIENINQILLIERAKRQPPGLDNKCLTSWNGLMVSGLLEAYKATQNTEYYQLGITCIDALLTHQIMNGKVWHSYNNGTSTIDGMLEDYAFLAQACLDAYCTSGKEKYLEYARDITTMAIEKFYDAEKELFYFNEKNELILQTVELYDNVTPSTNSAMVHVLHAIGLIDGNPTYLKTAERLIGKVQNNISSYPVGHSNWARAHLLYSKPFFEIVIVGDNAQKIATKFQKIHLPNVVILYSKSPSTVAILKNRFTVGETNIFVCEKGVCQLPVKTIEEALKMINND